MNFELADMPCIQRFTSQRTSDAVCVACGLERTCTSLHPEPFRAAVRAQHARSGT